MKIQNLKSFFTIAKQSSFARNWSILTIAGILSQFLGMIATIRIARVLSPDGYGEYNIIQTFAAIGAVIGGLGLRNVLTRNVARAANKSMKLLITGGLLRAGSFLFSILLLYLYIIIIPGTLHISLMSIVFLILFSSLYWDLLESIAFGNKIMIMSGAINIAGSLIWVIFIWSMPNSLLTVVTVGFSFALLQLAKTISYFVMYSRKLPTGDEEIHTLRLIKDSFPFYWLDILTAISNQIPILFLAGNSSKAEVGFYNIGFRLLNPLQIFLYSALTSIYPSLAQKAVSDPKRYLQITQYFFLGISLVGTMIALIISILRMDIVVLLFGLSYTHSADAMAYQCWYTVLYAMFCMIGISLAASDKQNWLAILSTAYSTIALPFLWIGSQYGAVGLAIGILIAACVNMVYHWIIFQRTSIKNISLMISLLIFVFPLIGFLLSFTFPQNLSIISKISLIIVILILFGSYFYKKKTVIKEVLIR